MRARSVISLAACVTVLLTGCSTVQRQSGDAAPAGAGPSSGTATADPSSPATGTPSAGTQSGVTQVLGPSAATGDRAALDELLVRIGPQVLHRCMRFLPCRQDAEEACRDVLLQVATHIGGFAGRSKFTT
jgi:hypothetical protein